MLGGTSYLPLTSGSAVRSPLKTISLRSIGGLFAFLTLFNGLVQSTAPVMAVQGLGRNMPYPEAEGLTRTAADAVLARSGSEDCLRGKLTNALLDLSSSCEIEGLSSSLCELADDVASREDEFSFAEMTSTATSLLQLLDAGNGPESP